MHSLCYPTHTVFGKICLVFTAFALLVNAGRSVAVEPPIIWPLCGRLGEQPGNWQHGDACPHTLPDPARHDLPIHNGFGPRNFVNTARPMSFHRGIDLATRSSTDNNGFIGNPVFAVCDGFVYRILGEAPDQTLELKCPELGVEDGATHINACNINNRCITAAYRHVQGLLVGENEFVERGAHLGYTGSTAPNGDVFPHLHFEFLDPRDRPSSTNNGLTAFSKDAINPLRYLPLVLPSAPTLQVALDTDNTFADYIDGAPPLVLQVQTKPGFLHDFVSLSVEIYQHDLDLGVWQRLEKDLTLIAEESGMDGLSEYSTPLKMSYPVADGSAYVSRYAPEYASRFYTPFSANSTLWQQAEHKLTWYQTLFGGNHPGIDGLLERNAEGKLPNGHWTQDFDFRLVLANPNPNQTIHGPNDPNEWWGLRIGLREYGPVLEDPFCVRAEVEQLPAVQGSSPRRHTLWLGQPGDIDCSGAAAWMGIFRDGFESP